MTTAHSLALFALFAHSVHSLPSTRPLPPTTPFSPTDFRSRLQLTLTPILTSRFPYKQVLPQPHPQIQTRSRRRPPHLGFPRSPYVSPPSLFSQPPFIPEQLSSANADQPQTEFSDKVESKLGLTPTEADKAELERMTPRISVVPRGSGGGGSDGGERA